MTDRAAEFHAHFKRQEKFLSEGIENIKSADIALQDRQTSSNDLSIALSNLSSELADIARDLPNHDVKIYTSVSRPSTSTDKAYSPSNALLQQIRDIRDRLSTAQASLAPKSKFSFKSKRSINQPPPAPAETTAVTPAYTPFNTQAQDSADTINIEHLDSTYTSLPQTSSPSQSPQQCIVSNLKSCLIDLSPAPSQPTLATLTLSSLQKTLVLAPHVDGPIHITSLQDCALFLACRQFRMHDCSRVDVFLRCSSRPIIEDCMDIRFAPLPGDFFGAGTRILSVNVNRWNQVDDFKWLKSEPSPNWYAVDERHHEHEEENQAYWKRIKDRIEVLREAQSGDKLASGIDELLLLTNSKQSLESTLS